jgi:hypothetical protein
VARDTHVVTAMQPGTNKRSIADIDLPQPPTEVHRSNYCSAAQEENES